MTGVPAAIPQVFAFVHGGLRNSCSLVGETGSSRSGEVKASRTMILLKPGIHKKKLENPQVSTATV